MFVSSFVLFLTPCHLHPAVVDTIAQTRAKEAPKAAADAAATKGSDKLLDRNDSDDLRARLAALDAPTAPIGGVAEGKSTDAGGGDGKQLSLDELQRRFKGLQG